MNKYKIKLGSGKVVGPINENQFAQMYLKGLISGNEPCCLYGEKNWSRVQDYSELASMVLKILNNEISLDDLEAEASKKEATPKTQPSHSENVDAEVKEELGDKSRKEHPLKQDPMPLVEEGELTGTFDEKQVGPEHQDGNEVTGSLTTGNEDEGDNFDKTIINPDLLSVPKAQTRNEIDQPMIVPKEEDESETKAEDEIPKEPSLDLSSKTAFFNLEDLKKEKGEKKSPVEAVLALEKVPEEEKKEEEEKVVNPNSKIEQFMVWFRAQPPAKRIGITIVGIFVFYFIFLDDSHTDPEFQLILPRINRPVPFKVANGEKSKQAYAAGMALYKENDYLSKVKASLKFRESLEHKFRDNPALGKLILVNAELLEHARPEILITEFSDRDRSKPALGPLLDQLVAKMKAGKDIIHGAKELDWLVSIAEPNFFKDIHIATGTVKFYIAMKKYRSAIVKVENYLRVAKPSPKLLSYYLEALIYADEKEKAEKVYAKFKGLPKKLKVYDIYIVLIKYHLYKLDFDSAKKELKEALVRFPKGVDFLLDLSKIYLSEENFKGLAKVMQTVKEVGTYGSRLYLSRYLEYLGMLSLSQKGYNTGVALIEYALKFNESDELRSKFALLDVGGPKSTEKLIIESKIRVAMKKAKDAWRDGDLGMAFSHALAASDMSANYIPSKILLAKIQVALGFFNESIKTLEYLANEYSLSPTVNFNLVDVYTQAYKFSAANNRLLSMRNIKQMANSHRFQAARAKLFGQQGKKLFEREALLKAEKKNPLEGEYHYLLALNYLKDRVYRKVKSHLVQAISLDPGNVDYRIKYASILYELSGAEIAIGYLRDLLEDHKDHPKILADIAIYYYRSGQTKNFEEYKERLEGLKRNDKSLYIFLAEKAGLEDKPNEQMDFLKQASRIDPADIQLKVGLGKMYIKRKEYGQAKKLFKEIEKRLDSFPKLYFYFAKIELEQGNFAEAERLAQKEIDTNKALESGYVLMGEIKKATGKYREAEQNFTKAREINRSSVEALLGLAWIKYRKNLADQALDLYTKAKNLEPGNPVIRRELGYVYKALGQGALAVENFNTYLDLVPNAKDRAVIQRIVEDLR